MATEVATITAVRVIENAGAGQMAPAHARSVVQTAKRCARVLRKALLILRECNGHRALGYRNWEEFCKAEFNLAQTQAWWHLSAARVERDVFGEEGAPPGVGVCNLRALACLEAPADRREVWARAVRLQERPTILLLNRLAKLARSGRLAEVDEVLSETRRQHEDRRATYRRQRLAKGRLRLEQARSLFAGTPDFNASALLQAIDAALAQAPHTEPTAVVRLRGLEDSYGVAS